MVWLDSIDDNVLMGQGGDNVLIATEGKDCKCYVRYEVHKEAQLKETLYG